MSETVFAPGQCWVSSTEAELGLGIVLEAAHRRIQLHFPTAGETRSYAMANAPLSRVRYRPGQQIEDHELNSYTVQDVSTVDHCYIYTVTDSQGQTVQLPETRLNPQVQFSRPQDRLFAGHLDANRAFVLRSRVLQEINRLQRSPVRGLLGPRVQLLPHQLYIAQEVSHRYAPRVLLADEVGLGKTIEAGMIIHQQILSGRASRILIVVPDSLLHQWLVEMLRRFNLMFTVLDEERAEALAESGEDNPFLSSQLVLCQLSWLVQQPERCQQAQQAGWDLMVVDEAHHLEWSEQQVSPAYQVVEKLAQQVAGLLLLTATPEQLGVAGHFARLRLLDPNRFTELDRFMAEEQQYQSLSELLDVIQQAESLAELQQQAASYQVLQSLLAEQLDAASENWAHSRQQLIQALLDRHGTGRVLFRNTRTSVSGFPGRELHSYPLTLPDALQQASLAELSQPQLQLGEQWVLQDPRVEWLLAFLQQHRDEKVLLICASADTAIALEQYLRLRQGLSSAVFHEGMSLVNRDRAAAYFADSEEGARLLVCSEIGSEGRNFQFCRHLVLFDLPLNPDLLEQRIGRLDRIGQRHTVQIHVPYFIDSVQQRLLQWLDQGLQAFTEPGAWGAALFQQQSTALQTLLQPQADPAAFAALLTETGERVAALRQQLEQGRDRLLELNSCPPIQAEAVVEAMVEHEQRHELSQIMDQIFDQFGVEQEPHSANSQVLRPGDHMSEAHFPGLPEEGLTVTYSREMALSREDIDYLSWEHPMVTGSIDLVLNGEMGNATFSSLHLPPLKPGTLMVEAIFLLRCSGPAQLQLHRYLPLTPIRCLLDDKGNDLTELLSEDRLQRLCRDVPRRAAHDLVKHGRDRIEALLDQLKQTMLPQQQSLIEQALSSMQSEQGEEINRLQSLAAVNPSVRPDELAYHQQLSSRLQQYIEQAELQLDCLRVILVAPK